MIVFIKCIYVLHCGCHVNSRLDINALLIKSMFSMDLLNRKLTILNLNSKNVSDLLEISLKAE